MKKEKQEISKISEIQRPEDTSKIFSYFEVEKFRNGKILY